MKIIVDSATIILTLISRNVRTHLYLVLPETDERRLILFRRLQQQILLFYTVDVEI